MECSILEQFSKDETYRQFCEDDFDAKSFATRVIRSHAVSQQLSSLAQGISLLDKELNQQVSDHYEDLMSQATGIEALEGVLQVIQARSQSLLAAVEKIRSRVVEPHDKIVARTLQLRRIQETCDMLRQVIREMYLSRRLCLQVSAGSKDATKAAQSLSELEYLSSNGLDLTGISVLEGERKFIVQARLEVQGMAEKMLQEAMLVQNQSQVATSLQIFFNLNLLATTTDKFINNTIHNIQTTVRSTLDVSSAGSNNDKRGGPGRVSGMAVVGGNSAMMRASLWTNLEKLADDVYTAYTQILLLQKVLARKKDPVTQVLFLHHLRETKGDAYGRLTEDFWQAFTKALKKDMVKSSEVSILVKQALESEYPKLLRLFLDLYSRIQSQETSTQPTYLFDQPELTFQLGGVAELNAVTGLDEKNTAQDPQQQMVDSFKKFENAYLSRSLSRLFDPINLVFSSSSSSSLPSSADQEAIIKTMSSELMVSSFDSRLNELIARNVSKTITMFCTKYEQQVINSEDAIQLSSSSSSSSPNDNDASSSSASSSSVIMVTDAQVRNIEIVNSLLHFHQAAQKAFKSINGATTGVVNHLKESLKHISTLVHNILDPLLTAIQTRIEETIYNMHNEDYSMPIAKDQQSPPSPPPASLYIESLKRFVHQVTSSHLQRINMPELLQPRLNQIARRCLELFVRHASMVYPLGEGGKIKLSADFAKVELTIKPLCDRLSDLGSSYRLVRAARPIMFQSTDLVASSTTPTEILPLSTSLHFLFSRGQPNLRPPYQTAGYSASRYSRWMDDHPTEKDRLLFIKGSLESYEQSVRSRGGKQFVDVYPVMLDLLHKGLL